MQNNVNKYLNATYKHLGGHKPRHSYNKVRGVRGQLVQEEVQAGLEEARYYRNYRRQSQNTTRNQPGGLLATGMARISDPKDPEHPMSPCYITDDVSSLHLNVDNN